MPDSEETGDLRDSSGAPYNYLATRRGGPPTPPIRPPVLAFTFPTAGPYGRYRRRAPSQYGLLGTKPRPYPPYPYVGWVSHRHKRRIVAQ